MYLPGPFYKRICFYVNQNIKLWKLVFEVEKLFNKGLTNLIPMTNKCIIWKLFSRVINVSLSEILISVLCFTHPPLCIAGNVWGSGSVWHAIHLCIYTYLHVYYVLYIIVIYVYTYIYINVLCDLTSSHVYTLWYLEATRWSVLSEFVTSDICTQPRKWWDEYWMK